jgi:hypothetical protein
MALPTTTEGVYDLLAADTTLAGLLGTYLFPDGTTLPALSRQFTNQPQDEPTTVPRGVEVVIWRITADDPQACATGEVIINPTIRMVATQWEPAATPAAYHLQAAVRRIQLLLPGCRSADTTVPDLTTGLEQRALSWQAPLVFEA